MAKKNNDDKCFQYALTVALNYQNIKKKLLKEYQTLNPLLINMIGKKEILHCTKKTGKRLNQIISQLLLKFYLRHTILKK